MLSLSANRWKVIQYLNPYTLVILFWISFLVLAAILFCVVSKSNIIALCETIARLVLFVIYFVIIKQLWSLPAREMGAFYHKTFPEHTWLRRNLALWRNSNINYRRFNFRDILPKFWIFDILRFIIWLIVMMNQISTISTVQFVITMLRGQKCSKIRYGYGPLMNLQ